MASKRNPSDPAGPSARPPRKPSTIDVEATELASEASVPAAGAPASAAPDRAEPPYTEPPKRDKIAWLPSGRLSLLGAAGMGAAGMLILLAALWFTGTIGGGGAVAFGDRLSVIEQRLRELPARPPGAVDQQALEELSTRIGRVEKSTFSPQPPLNDPALSNRLASAENATKAFADNIGSLNSRVDDLASAVRELRNMTPADKSEVDALAARIAALEKAAAAIENELGKRATVASDRAVRLALATAALRIAVERGEPFTAELAAARPLAPENAFVSLEPFAASGVPSNAVLARELSALVPALRRAADAMPAEGGFFTWLKANAGRLVRIRPADETPGDDPAIVITRVDVRATNADVAGALGELLKLPAAARAPAQGWIDKAQARITAIEESRKIAAGAIHALGNPGP